MSECLVNIKGKSLSKLIYKLFSLQIKFAFDIAFHFLFKIEIQIRFTYNHLIAKDNKNDIKWPFPTIPTLDIHQAAMVLALIPTLVNPINTKKSFPTIVNGIFKF